jgi:glutathione S-transferase
MGEVHRVFGSELSPYSVKVRSYLRYKGIPHEWVPRSALNEEEFRRHAKLPLIPVVVRPDGSALQDSTPIILTLEAAHPTPPLEPADPVLAFLSALLEEYADEWGNKPMFHYRWTYPADQQSAAERLARQMQPAADESVVGMVVEAVKSRMIPRLSFVGSSPATAPVVEGSFERQLALLERHLGSRPYLFGGRPALADLGLYAQLYQCSTDPTPAALMRARAPRVLAWIERMLAPRAQGDFEAWDALAPTLEPFLAAEVGGVFLPWSVANARALAAGAPEFTVQLDGRPFTQQPQKYHAKSLAALRARWAAGADRSRLEPILTRTGCLPWLGAEGR